MKTQHLVYSKYCIRLSILQQHILAATLTTLKISSFLDLSYHLRNCCWFYLHQQRCPSLVAQRFFCTALDLIHFFFTLVVIGFLFYFHALYSSVYWTPENLEAVNQGQKHFYLFYSYCLSSLPPGGWSWRFCRLLYVIVVRCALSLEPLLSKKTAGGFFAICLALPFLVTTVEEF